MNKILKAENYRLCKMPVYRITIIILMILGVLGTLLFWFAIHSISGELLESVGGYASDLDEFFTLNAVSYGSIALSLVHVITIGAAIIITVYQTSEYTYGTIHNLLARGQSRLAIYCSRWIMSIWIMIQCVLAFVIPAVATARIMWKENAITGEMFGKGIQLFCVELCLYIAVASIITFVAISMRHQGGALAWNLCLIVMGSMIVTFLKLMFSNGSHIAHFWIFSAIEDFAYLDITKQEIFLSIMISIGYTSISTILGAVLFQNRDIK